MKNLYFCISLIAILLVPNISMAKQDCSKIEGFKKKLECKIGNNPISQSKLKKKYSKKHKELENKTLMDIFGKKNK
jgi:hypothetical protein